MQPSHHAEPTPEHQSAHAEAQGPTETQVHSEKDLGLAGKLTKSFITSPLSIILFFAMLGAGIIGLISTPRQEDPQISVPIIDIFVNYPGASSEEVANIIVKPLDRLMSHILGVKHVYSVSDKGQAIITVEFDVGQKMGDSIIKVRDKLLSNLDFMPPGASQPLIKPKEIDDVPIINLTLWSKTLDDASLRSLAVEVLQQLEKIPDTNNSFIVGGRKQIFALDVYPSRLASYGISLSEVAEIVRNANVREQAGNIERDNTYLNIYAGSFLQKVSDIENLVVSNVDNKPVYIRDIASVSYKPEETNQMVIHYSGAAGEVESQGNQAVTIAIAKKYGTNGVEVASNILAGLEKLKGTIIPQEVEVFVSRDYGKSAKDKVDSLILKLFIATLAVTILVYIALGWRPALVVTLVIPVVLLMTIFSAWIFGMTIDRVSLFALIFSIGILVDDAIVVTENIYRRWLIDNKITIKTAIDAVREVGNPTILATFTVVAALVPMAAVSGMMGPYMAPIPILGSVAMIFSLFAAFVFAPYFIMKFTPPLKVLEKMHAREDKESKFLYKLFKGIITTLAFSRLKGNLFLFFLIITFFISIAMFYTTSVVVKMLPLDNKSEFAVAVDMSDGTSLPDTASLLHKMTQEIKNIPEIVAIQSYSGTSKPFDFNGLVRHYYLRTLPHHGELQITLVDKSQRTRKSHEIALEVRERLLPIAQEFGADFAVVEMPPGPPVLRPVVAEIYGPDHTTRQEFAREVQQLFESSNSMSDIDTMMRDEHPIINFKVDSNKASNYGVDAKTVQHNLAMILQDHNIGTIRMKSALEPSNIVMRVPLSKRSQLEYLVQLPIPTKYGTSIALSEIGNFEYVKQDDLIYHKDLYPVEYVMGEPVGRLSAPIYAMGAVDTLLKDYTSPNGSEVSAYYFSTPKDTSDVGMAWAGEWTVTFETFRDMGAAFMVALVVIYMLVVWQFGSFLIPGIIMAPIPLTLLGIIPGHYLLGAEFSATSMIGWIALAGIIVRNSILLVDFTVHEYSRGVDFFEAVIRSCSSRTRPILITALALVGGSSVILSDPIFQGMAISLLFGVIISTILTLIVIPLGTISAGEKAIRNVALSMGLIDESHEFSSIDALATSSPSTPTGHTKTPDTAHAKKWINRLLQGKNADKIDTKDLLKSEG